MPSTITLECPPTGVSPSTTVAPWSYTNNSSFTNLFNSQIKVTPFSSATLVSATLPLSSSLTVDTTNNTFWIITDPTFWTGPAPPTATPVSPTNGKLITIAVGSYSPTELSTTITATIKSEFPNGLPIDPVPPATDNFVHFISLIFGYDGRNRRFYLGDERHTIKTATTFEPNQNWEGLALYFVPSDGVQQKCKDMLGFDTNFSYLRADFPLYATFTTRTTRNIYVEIPELQLSMYVGSNEQSKRSILSVIPIDEGAQSGTVTFVPPRAVVQKMRNAQELTLSYFTVNLLKINGLGKLVPATSFETDVPVTLTIQISDGHANEDEGGGGNPLPHGDMHDRTRFVGKQTGAPVSGFGKF